MSSQQSNPNDTDVLDDFFFDEDDDGIDVMGSDDDGGLESLLDVIPDAESNAVSEEEEDIDIMASLNAMLDGVTLEESKEGVDSMMSLAQYYEPDIEYAGVPYDLDAKTVSVHREVSIGSSLLIDNVTAKTLVNIITSLVAVHSCDDDPLLEHLKMDVGLWDMKQESYIISNKPVTLSKKLIARLISLHDADPTIRMTINLGDRTFKSVRDIGLIKMLLLT